MLTSYIFFKFTYVNDFNTVMVASETDESITQTENIII